MVEVGGRQLQDQELRLRGAMQRRQACFVLKDRVKNCDSGDEDADQSCKL